MNTEIIKLDSAGIITIYETAEQRVAKARNLWNDKYKDMPYTPENAAAMESFEKNCKTAKTEINAARSPFTRQLAEIPKLFTVIEGELDTFSGGIAQKRLDFNRAALKKQEEEKAIQEREANKNRIIAAFVPDVKQHLLDLMLDVKQAYIGALIEGKEGDKFELGPDGWNAACGTILTRLNGADFRADLIAAIAPEKEGLIKSFNDNLQEWRLATMKSKGKVEALQNIGRALGLTYQQQREELATEKEAAELNVEVQAATVVPSEPEVKSKWVCKPKNTGEVLKVLSYWVGAENVSVEDLMKVCSKAFTMANRMGLKGEKIEGVTYEKDAK